MKINITAHNSLREGKLTAKIYPKAYLAANKSLIF